MWAAIVLTLVVLPLGILLIVFMSKNASSKEIKQWPRQADANRTYICISSWQESYWVNNNEYYRQYAIMKEEYTWEYILFATPEVLKIDEEYKIPYNSKT